MKTKPFDTEKAEFILKYWYKRCTLHHRDKLYNHEAKSIEHEFREVDVKFEEVKVKSLKGKHGSPKKDLSKKNSK
jgi:hypothetical protein